MTQHLRDHGRDVWFLDLTGDLGLPVYAAISARAGDGGGIGFGFAADSTGTAAAEQAAMELLQILRRYDSFERSTKGARDATGTLLPRGEPGREPFPAGAAASGAAEAVIRLGRWAARSCWPTWPPPACTRSSPT